MVGGKETTDDETGTEYGEEHKVLSDSDGVETPVEWEPLSTRTTRLLVRCLRGEHADRVEGEQRGISVSSKRKRQQRQGRHGRHGQL